MTAPSGARLPFSTARLPCATSGRSRGRITSAFHVFAPSMFSPSVRPVTVMQSSARRSAIVASSARKPPA
jgi:hypothetical protein